jgi:prevent-host-death family protein
MGKHSVAEAKNCLSSLIDRVLEGEDVVITRHGTPVVELKPVQRIAGPITAESVAWLDAHRVTPLVIGDAGELLRTMRDEDDERL